MLPFTGVDRPLPNCVLTFGKNAGADRTWRLWFVVETSIATPVAGGVPESRNLPVPLEAGPEGPVKAPPAVIVRCCRKRDKAPLNPVRASVTFSSETLNPALWALSYAT